MSLLDVVDAYRRVEQLDADFMLPTANIGRRVRDGRRDGKFETPVDYNDLFFFLRRSCLSDYLGWRIIATARTWSNPAFPTNAGCMAIAANSSRTDLVRPEHIFFGAPEWACASAHRPGSLSLRRTPSVICGVRPCSSATRGAWFPRCALQSPSTLF